MPYRETPPYVGFTPTVPVTAAGWRIEPPVSVPMASGASNAASDAAEPPPEPPGMREVSHGLRVGPYAECSVELPIANSSMLVLPRITTPALRSRAATVASYGGRHPSRIFEPQVVGMSEVASTSLSASGTPASGEAGSFPLASAASTSAAAASAGWVATCRKACTTGSTSVMRSRWAWVASTADTSRLWIFSANSAAVNRVSSALIARLRARSAPRSLALAAMLARCRLRYSCFLPQDPGHLEPALLTGRGAGQRLLLGQPGTDLVGPEHVGQRHRVGGRLDLVSGDLADSGHRGQDDVELAGEPVELGLGDREPGQPGEVGDLGAGDGPAGRVGRRLRHFPPGQEWLEHVPGAKPSITTLIRTLITARAPGELLKSRSRCRTGSRPGAVHSASRHSTRW